MIKQIPLCLALLSIISIYGMQEPFTDIVIQLDSEITMHVSDQAAWTRDYDTKIPYILVWMYKNNNRTFGESFPVHLLEDKNDGDIIWRQYDNGHSISYRCNQKADPSSGKTFKEALQYVLEKNKKSQ